MFGGVLDINAIGAGVLPPDTMIPGVAVASTRATPLAGRLITGHHQCFCRSFLVVMSS